VIANYSVYAPSFTPSTPFAADGTPLNIGVRFRSDIPGKITAIRFYNTDTGITFTGSLWSNAGTLLGQGTVVSSVSGWQECPLASPVDIAAGTTYVASYWTNNATGFALDTSFASTGVDNAPLHLLQTNVDGSNGVFDYSGSVIFPASTFGANNYMVDAVLTVFDLAAGTAAAMNVQDRVQAVGSKGTVSVYTPSDTPTVASSPDATPVNLGVRFRSDQPGTITGVRFYNTAVGITFTVGLWTNAGTLLGSGTVVSTVAGWQQADLPSPVAISANTTYVASYFNNNAGSYAIGTKFLLAGVDNPPLHLLKDGVDGVDGAFEYTGGLTFPASTFGSNNYFVDVAMVVTDVLAVGQCINSPDSVSAACEITATPTKHGGDDAPRGISYQEEREETKRVRLDDIFDLSVKEYYNALQGVPRLKKKAKELAKPYTKRQKIDFASLGADIEAVQALINLYIQHLLDVEDEEVIVLLLAML
jgi:hypothetical protein